ncbi:response regulator transcription factor [Rhodocytophaga aerolata]|uniref:Response regulator transcription factor n=1 Tax=Rhodocytophaga aerolata TaxID=455078 RepID=A0ABT8R4U9_9BACT|nr:response regulator transcription factor [Rhodocytophaga aerolata]MDO1446959.1 response regulator transcription factor [Rhodocytophaga aerolata]
MPSLIRLIIADDHQMFLDGICELTANLPDVEVVATAANGEQVIHLLERMPCDMVILDIQMPVQDGLTTTRQIKKRFPHVKVLILTMNNELSLIKHMLEAGALGYILKTNGREELARAIRRVASGLNYFSDAVAQELARQYLTSEGAKTRENGNTAAEAHLSDREKEIIALVAREYSSVEIADILFIAPTTVDTHRRNAMNKLGVKNLAGLVKYALKSGLIN